jgi:hypothetical protein
MLFFAVLLMTQNLFSETPTSCVSWFAKAKISKGKGCELKCAMIGSDMGTFDCQRFCDDLCRQPSPENARVDYGPFKVSNLYPLLTDKERDFVDSNPLQALEAYRLSHSAESICSSEYKYSGLNDESDACRHFVWAVLLDKSLGSETSEQILDAHETNSGEPENEKAMDLANNRRGLIAAKKFDSSKEGWQSSIIKQFKDDLNSGRIVVLKKRKK